MVHHSCFWAKMDVLNLVAFVVQSLLKLQCDMLVFETSHTFIGEHNMEENI